jgi:tRNA dimethylallyltransferase
MNKVMKKYWIITFGCQMNEADSERISSILEKMGYQAASKESGADLIVVNMCSVRQSAVDRVYGKAKNLSKLKKINPKLKTVLTGCILKKDRNKFRRTFNEIWDNKNYIDVLPEHPEGSIAYIPISNGCNNFCAYCVVPFTRGTLACRSHKEILKEARKASKSSEIWLLGQNVNDYTSPADPSVDFPELLRLANDIPGNFQIRFTSPNPKNFSDNLIKVMADSDKVAKYLNLPIQSGDNEILKKMRRPYTVKQYKDLVSNIRKKIPNIFLSTDIIVGFPGETKKQFENTLKLFKEIGFNMAYISKYSPRPGTLAAGMKDNVPRKEKERRWKILNDILLRKWKKRTEPTERIIVVLGPTSSGKSDLAVKLARNFNGEIVSADSRQVYKGMDIGSGKINKTGMKGIPHHLLDVASPKRKFTVSQYRKLALKAINKIFKKGKLPILCGGSGFYLQAVIDGIMIPKVKPDWKLRKKMEKKTAQELFKELKSLDRKRAETIDKNNKRRLIRALEIVIKTKKTISPLRKQPLPYPVLMLGIKKGKEELKELIRKRLLKRLEQGKMIKEIKKLHKDGVSWKRLEDFGLEYRFVAQYLQGKIKKNEMINLIQKESEQYGKRQMTWFKRDERICWIKDHREAKRLIKEFLEKNKGRRTFNYPRNISVAK